MLYKHRKMKNKIRNMQPCKMYLNKENVSAGLVVKIFKNNLQR